MTVFSEASVNRETQAIEQVGVGLGDRDGCDVVTLSAEQAVQVEEAMAQPHGGLVLAGDGTITALPLVEEPVSDPVRSAIESATTLEELKAALLGQAA